MIQSTKCGLKQLCSQVNYTFRNHCKIQVMLYLHYKVKLTSLTHLFIYLYPEFPIQLTAM